ncbi:hypothetical protein ACFFMN_05760 [Planobispora siamensis]|uniref:Uncharacterized protein n=1 Tax=Planobispora siamensis TaxID=936338 RepID=A0A8J3SKL4_9ACTN|nr:hypothetical protein [Planobispora siamensis]GIH94311.1 hypothetical protein Psi01_49410 [Planobispora siamensis]
MRHTFRTLIATGAAAAAVLSGTAAHAATIPDFKQPKVFGTTFQADPGHDFTKGIHSRRDGILRGWITSVRGRVAEYEPIRWKRDKHTEGYFVGPPEGDVRAYASPVASGVRYLSAYGCTSAAGGLTVDRRTGLGAKRCSRSTLIKRVKNEKRPALITVYRGEIVQVQEIFTP